MSGARADGRPVRRRTALVAAVLLGTLALVIVALRRAPDEPSPRAAPGVVPASAPDATPRERHRAAASGSVIQEASAEARVPARSVAGAQTSPARIEVANPDGGPAGGASVTMYRRLASGEAEWVAETTADAHGRAEFRLPAGSYFVRAASASLLGASPDGPVPHRGNSAAPSFFVSLRPAEHHRGSVVVESDGTPISGARVIVDDGGLARETTTDAFGRFEFARVTRSHEPSVRAEAAGHVDAERRVESRTDEAVTWRLTMHPATTVRGTLRLGGTAPRGAGDVWLLVVHDGHEAGGVRLRPDAEGRFEASFRAWGGAGELFVRGRGFAPTRLPVLGGTPGLRDAGLVDLLPAGTVRGRVVDRDGRPVGGVFVGARALDPSLGVGQACTDASGRFEIGGVGAGEHEVVAREVLAPPFGGAEREAVRRGVFAGADLVLELAEGNALLVRLRDAAGAPLAARVVRVSVRSAGGTEWAGTTFAENAHTVRVAIPTPGVRDLRVDADGHDPVERLGVEFPDGRAAPLDVVLVPSAR